MSGPSVFTPFGWVALATFFAYQMLTHAATGDPFAVFMFVCFVIAVLMVKWTAEYWEEER